MSRNPPAFPNTGNNIWNLIPTKGMTLRDWFAGQALAGAASTMTLPEGVSQITIEKECEKLAAVMFTIADAMLAERGGE